MDDYDDYQEIQDLKELATLLHSRGKDKKSMEPDLVKMGFYPEVVHESEQFFHQEMGGVTRRKKIRSKLAFYIAYRAHQKLGITISPYEIARKAGLSKGEIGKARTENFTNHCIKTCHVHINTVDSYIMYYCDTLEIPEMKEVILKYKKSILSDIPSELHNKQPHILAATVIYMYITQNPIDNFTIKKIIGLEGITQNILNKARNLISSSIYMANDDEEEEEIMKLLK